MYITYCDIAYSIMLYSMMIWYYNYLGTYKCVMCSFVSYVIQFNCVLVHDVILHADILY